MKEPQPKHVYLPIPDSMIVALKGKSDKELRELGVSSEGLRSLLSQGFVPQLREDIFKELSHALGLDT